MIKNNSLITIFSFILCFKADVANAEIYAIKDHNGYIIYSNKIPEQNVIIVSSTTHETAPLKNAFSALNEKNSDFHVSKDLQLKRDVLRKKILTSELNEESNSYIAAKNKADSIEANIHKNNIELLKKELNPNTPVQPR